MRIAAGIVGILIGISSLIYIGLFGGLLGSATTWLGSGPWTHGGDANIIGLGQMISLLSWLSGLLAIVGGIFAFSRTRFGGAILAASALSHWYLLGFSVIGKLFILPIGITAAFAFFSARSEPQATLVTSASVPSNPQPSTPCMSASFDRAKWNALVQYDKDIASVTERLKSLGPKWIDEFASAFLALNDKSYLSEIEEKIVLSARAEAEETRKLEVAAEERRQAAAREQARAAEARREQIEAWKYRIWGTRQRKALSVGLIGLLVAAVIGGMAAHQLQQRRDIETWLSKHPSATHENGTNTYTAMATKSSCFGTVYLKTGCGNKPDLNIGGWGDYYYDYLQFDISSLPPSAITSRAELWVYGSAPNDPQLRIERVTSDWPEGDLSSTNNPSSVAFSVMPPIPSAKAWIKADVTDLYKGWKDGRYSNFGIKLVPLRNDHTNGSIASANNPNTDIRPKLAVIIRQ